MKKLYELLELNLVRFDEDVITSSITSSEPKVDVGAWGGFDTPVN